MRFCKRVVLWAAIIMAALTTCTANAQFLPRIETNVNSSRGQVLINGRVALSFLSSNGSLSPAERARITAERLVNLINAGMEPNSIYAKGDKRTGKVAAGNNIICLVTPADAKINKTESQLLAKVWATNIRNLLLMPPVVLSQNNVVVPVGESRYIKVGGAATGPINPTVADNKVAATSVSNDARIVAIHGIQPGYTLADIEVNGEIVTLHVSVKKYAGTIIQPKTEAIVTGEPCPKDVLAAALDRAVMRAVFCEPGAQMRIIGRDGISTELLAGGGRAATARVKITGPDYIPYSSTVSVIIRNEMMGYTKPDLLFYSNNPEKLTDSQVLFAGKTTSEKETRLLFHHQNDSGRKLRISVEVINFNLTPVSFRVFPGNASVNTDTVIVGYSAGRSFLSNYSNNVSILDAIPGQSRLTIVSEVIKNGETTSGILELSQVQGDEAYIIVRASDPAPTDPVVGAITPAPDKAMWKMSSHVYPTPAKSLEENYEIGNRWKFISVGKLAIQSSDAQRKLDGNYGVSYNINLKVKNPLAEKGKVSIMFDATAGFASVVFLINGRIVGEKYVKPPHEAHMASYTLEPGEERELKIVFIPLAGSNYPAKLVVRS